MPKPCKAGGKLINYNLQIQDTNIWHLCLFLASRQAHQWKYGIGGGTLFTIYSIKTCNQNKEQDIQEPLITTSMRQHLYNYYHNKPLQTFIYNWLHHIFSYKWMWKYLNISTNNDILILIRKNVFIMSMNIQIHLQKTYTLHKTDHQFHAFWLCPPV